MSRHPDKSGSFANWEEFDAFQARLKSNNEWKPVPVLHPYANIGETEQWFLYCATGETWRLVEPDAPFQGCWERVTPPRT